MLSVTDPILEIRIIKGLWSSFPIIIMSCAMIGNPIAICTLCRKRLRFRRSSVYLMTLALADFVAIFTGSLLSKWVEFGLGTVNRLSPRCNRLQDFLNRVARAMATFLVVFMTMERVMAVWFPYFAARFCKKSTTYIVIVAILLFTGLFYGHFVVGVSTWCPDHNVTTMAGYACPADWEKQDRDCLKGRDNNDSCGIRNVSTPEVEAGPGKCIYLQFYQEYWSIIDSVVCFYSPLLLVILGDLAVVYKVFFQTTWVFTTPVGDGRVTTITGVGKRRVSKMTQITTMLNAVYFFATLPLVIQNFIQEEEELNFYRSKKNAQMALSYAVVVIVLYARGSLDFLVFCAISPSFRVEFKRLSCELYLRATVRFYMLFPWLLPDTPVASQSSLPYQYGWKSSAVTYTRAFNMLVSQQEAETYSESRIYMEWFYDLAGKKVPATAPVTRRESKVSAVVIGAAAGPAGTGTGTGTTEELATELNELKVSPSESKISTALQKSILLSRPLRIDVEPPEMASPPAEDEDEAGGYGSSTDIPRHYRLGPRLYRKGFTLIFRPPTTSSHGPTAEAPPAPDALSIKSRLLEPTSSKPAKSFMPFKSKSTPHTSLPSRNDASSSKQLLLPKLSSVLCTSSDPTSAVHVSDLDSPEATPTQWQTQGGEEAEDEPQSRAEAEIQTPTRREARFPAYAQDMESTQMDLVRRQRSGRSVPLGDLHQHLPGPSRMAASSRPAVSEEPLVSRTTKQGPPDTARFLSTATLSSNISAWSDPLPDAGGNFTSERTSLVSHPPPRGGGRGGGSLERLCTSSPPRSQGRGSSSERSSLASPPRLPPGASEPHGQRGCDRNASSTEMLEEVTPRLCVKCSLVLSVSSSGSQTLRQTGNGGQAPSPGRGERSPSPASPSAVSSTSGGVGTTFIRVRECSTPREPSRRSSPTSNE